MRLFWIAVPTLVCHSAAHKNQPTRRERLSSHFEEIYLGSTANEVDRPVPTTIRRAVENPRLVGVCLGLASATLGYLLYLLVQKLEHTKSPAT